LFLDGKIRIVTGAAGGLGFEIAKELTKNGATVIITSRKKSKLRKACSLINKNCHGFELDVSNRKSVMKLIGNA
jgi:NADP-dependent 3-hydroxy acid dehydrogenase YdfG